MARRVFISYEGSDRNRAKGFNLLQWNKNVDIDFVGRHLLDPVDSTNKEYISRKINEQIKGTSVTVVLIGQHTSESNWVAEEVRQSLQKGNPNGILGIKLDADAPIPEFLHECGAEIIEWEVDQFQDAIERASQQADRAKELIRTGSTSGGSCVR